MWNHEDLGTQLKFHSKWYGEHCQFQAKGSHESNFLKSTLLPYTEWVLRGHERNRRIRYNVIAAAKVMEGGGSEKDGGS